MNPQHAAARDTAAEERAAAAALTALCTPQCAPAATVLEPETHEEQHARKRLCGRPAGINEQRRRHAIHELYVNMGSPTEELWRGRGGTVSQIRTSLRLPVGSDRCILMVLMRTAEEGERFDGRRYGGSGRVEKLTLAEALIAADELESGAGQT